MNTETLEQLHSYVVKSPMLLTAWAKLANSNTDDYDCHGRTWQVIRLLDNLMVKLNKLL